MIVPPLKSRKAVFVKVTSRAADDWPALSLAVTIDANGTTIRDARVILSAATDKVTRLENTERLLASATVGEELLRRAGESAVAEVSLLSDAHGSAAYKRELLRVTLSRALRKALS